ncbi:protein kinase domain-containing protein [Roseateles sp. P5_E1]
MTAMSFDELRTLSQLLDEGLELAPAARPAWLAALPLGALRERLAQMLDRHDAGEHEGFLAALPGLAEPLALRAGERVGPYRLLRPLGRGGMGEVWLADRADGLFERQVALKLPRGHWADGEAFARETGLVARLEHPRIARLYDAGLEPGPDGQSRPYLAIAYVEGRPLDEAAAGLALPARLRLFVTIARTLAYAHGRLVLHRDLKPANVLVDAEGRPHLLDFGIAAVLGVVGPGAPPPACTPRYAAPELLLGGELSVQVDVYALGVMLGELVAEAGDADLAAVVAGACATEPGRRYASADALADEVERWLRQEPVQARAAAPLRRLGLLLRRRRRAAVLAGGVLVVVGALAVQLAGQRQRAALAAERENVATTFVAEMFRFGAEPQARHPHGDGEVPLLERGAQLIEQRFAGDPAQRARLYRVLGDAYETMGAAPLAVNLRERELASLRAQAAPADETRAAAQRLGRARLDAGRPDEVLAALPDTPGDVDTGLLKARALVDLGRMDEAETLLARLPAPADAAGQAWRHLLRGELLNRRGHEPEALVEFRAAAAGEDTLAAAEAGLRGARWAAQQGRHDDALALLAPALATLRERGGLYAVRAEVGAANVWSAMYATTLSLPFERVRAELEACLQRLRALGDGVPPLLLAQVQGHLGRLLLNWGDVAQGAPLVEADYTQRLPLLHRPVELTIAHGRAGDAAMERGQHELAAQRFALRRQARVAAGKGLHPLLAGDIRLQALNASMAGEMAGALRFLDEAPAPEALRGAGHDPAWYEEVLREARARVLVDSGDAALARQALALASRHEAKPQDAMLTAGFATGPELLRAEGQCLQPDARAGLARMRAFVAALSLPHHPAAPQIARLHGVAALCAWRAGDRDQAARWAALARTALATQPGVSPYYSAPLHRLEAQACGSQVGCLVIRR